MKAHADLPTLCPECHQLALADPWPYVVRWCEHRRTLALGFKGGGIAIVAWDLHLIPTDPELGRFAPLLAQLFAAGQVAEPSIGTKQ